MEQEIVGESEGGGVGTPATPRPPPASSAGPSRVPSPVRPSLPVSTHVQNVYTEKSGGGFSSSSGIAKSIMNCTALKITVR